MSSLAEIGQGDHPDLLGNARDPRHVGQVMVMHEGRKVGEISRAEATQEKILHMATGRAR